MEQISIDKKILVKSSNLDIMSYGFPKGETSRKIQEKMVWSTKGTILFTQ